MAVSKILVTVNEVRSVLDDVLNLRGRFEAGFRSKDTEHRALIL